MSQNSTTTRAATLEFPNLAPTKAYSFTLEKGQWLEISQEPSLLRVVSGNAWVIVQKRDLVLSSGQEKLLPVGKYPTVVLVLGDMPVALEIQSKTAPRLSS